MTLAERLTPSPPRVFVYDLETSPILAYTWRLTDANITPDQIVEPSRVLCWAGKWMDQRRVLFRSEFHDSREDMLRELWHCLNEAQIVVGYNQRGFDNGHIMREFILAGLGPPSPWVDVDLLAVNRRTFRFASNKLGYVTKALDVETKIDTGGQGLWRKVLHGDEKAWAKFRAYCKQDVVATACLAKVLWPYVGKHMPHVGLFSDDPTCCPACGSQDLTPLGFTYSKTGKWPRLLCACGAWCKVLANGQTRPI